MHWIWDAGTGRFTFVLATVAQAIDACDLSAALIEQARQNAKNQAPNVSLSVEDIVWAQPQPAFYDLVSCMGVLSTIIDDWAFRRILQVMRSALRPGGRLLLRDSLSRLPEGQLIESETYATRYRNEDAYRREFEELGLVLEYERLLVEFSARPLIVSSSIAFPASRRRHCSNVYVQGHENEYRSFLEQNQAFWRENTRYPNVETVAFMWISATTTPPI